MTLAEAPAYSLLDIENSSAENGVAELIERAMRMSASDLFFVANEQHTAIQMRQWGIMRNLAIVGVEQGKRLVSHVKASAGMDVTNTRRPLDGRWIYTEGEKSVDLRINSIPTIHGEDLAIRLFERDSQLFDLEYLGMDPEQLEQLRSMLHSPGGMILFTGPTGSGKTATLYACLSALNDGQRKINTIEDPVEFIVDGIRQSQVNGNVDLTFSELLRSILRQSPDVIMIGEIRDEETAKIAVHAANSGHLVLASVHAGSSPAAIQSLRAFGISGHFLASCLCGVVSQRLPRTLCAKCKVAFELPDIQTFTEIKHLLKAGEGTEFYGARGCGECHGTGYSGRAGVFEVMSITPAIKQLITDGAGTGELRKKATAEGMAEFRQAALLKVARGITSVEEIFRVIPAENMVFGD